MEDLDEAAVRMLLMHPLAGDPQPTPTDLGGCLCFSRAATVHEYSIAQFMHLAALCCRQASSSTEGCILDCMTH